MRIIKTRTERGRPGTEATFSPHGLLIIAMHEHINLQREGDREKEFDRCSECCQKLSKAAVGVEIRKPFT